jgi:hypothetical protein
MMESVLHRYMDILIDQYMDRWIDGMIESLLDAKMDIGNENSSHKPTWVEKEVGNIIQKKCYLDY